MKFRKLSILTVAVVLFTGCGDGRDNDSSSSDSDTSENSAMRTSASAAPNRGTTPQPIQEEPEQPLIAAPRLTGESLVPGDGLDQVVFANHRDEYQESLRLIAGRTNDEQYQQLDAALRYLMINDPSIMNDEQRLFDAINGKSGMEILQMTAELMDNRQR